MPKLILLGCGGVGKTILEMLPIAKFIPASLYREIVVIEKEDIEQDPVIKNMSKNIELIIEKIEITKANHERILTKYISEGDILIDVSYNIKTIATLEICKKFGAMYINTSIEHWINPTESEIKNNLLYDRCVHNRHNELIKHFSDNNDHLKLTMSEVKHFPTCVITQGMNPGLVSQFSLMALANISKSIISIGKKYKLLEQIKPIYIAYKNKDYASIAYLLGLRVLHCSEIDTQITKIKRKKGMFLNTWGPYSFYSEGVDPIQIGIGTHEKIYKLLKGKKSGEELIIKSKHLKDPSKYILTANPTNQVYAEIRGIDLCFESFVPSYGIIKGMAISHSENDTLNRFLTLYKDNQVFYRPSNYYVYSPCKDAWDSLSEVRNNNYEMSKQSHVLRNNEVASGSDLVGSLLIFEENPYMHILIDESDRKISTQHASKNKRYDLLCHLKKDIEEHSGTERCFWSGTILSIEQVRKLGFKYSAPTTIQVAASILSAIRWMLKNKNRGIIWPEYIDYNKIFKHAKRYLGKIVCEFVPYKPKGNELSDFIK
jgi:homospermidine synthase